MNMAVRSMHLPAKVTFHDFEIGRQAKTKQHTIVVDPTMVRAVTPNRARRSHFFAVIRRLRKIKWLSLARHRPVTNRHAAARKS